MSWNENAANRQCLRSFMYFSENEAAQGGIKCTRCCVTHQNYLSLQPFCNRRSGNPTRSSATDGNAEQQFYFTRMTSSPSHSTNGWCSHSFKGVDCVTVLSLKVTQMGVTWTNTKADYSGGWSCREGDMTDWTTCQSMPMNGKRCLKREGTEGLYSPLGGTSHSQSEQTASILYRMLEGFSSTHPQNNHSVHSGNSFYVTDHINALHSWSARYILYSRRAVSSILSPFLTVTCNNKTATERPGALLHATLQVSGMTVLC